MLSSQLHKRERERSLYLQLSSCALIKHNITYALLGVRWYRWGAHHHNQQATQSSTNSQRQTFPCQSWSNTTCYLPHHHVHVHVTIESKINKILSKFQISLFFFLKLLYWEWGSLLLFLKHKGTTLLYFGRFIHSFIYLSILWGRWIGDHPQEDLAKLGWRWKRKVIFKVISFLFSLSQMVYAY